MREAHVVQQPRRKVRKSLNLPLGTLVVTKRAKGVRDDTTNSFADRSADLGDNIGLYFSGATRAYVVVKRIRVIARRGIWPRFLDGIRENMDVIGRDPIRNHLMRIAWR